jgi:hypothetical protein
MKSARRFSMGFALLCCVTGCATTKPYNPFKVPQADIKSKVKIVALVPINVPTDLDNPDPVKSTFETLVAAKLKDGGYQVVPSDEYNKIWKQMMEQLGGFFDPMTGKRDNEKFKTVRQHTLRELAAKTKADAILDFSLSPIKVNFANNRAVWHGTSEYLMSGGAFAAFLGGSFSGSVLALSLVVDLSDINDVEMYVNAGGIQSLSKLSGSRFVNVPRSELFVDEERNRKAVDIALNPLIGKAVEPDKQPSEEKSY